MVAGTMKAYSKAGKKMLSEAKARGKKKKKKQAKKARGLSVLTDKSRAIEKETGIPGGRFGNGKKAKKRKSR